VRLISRLRPEEGLLVIGFIASAVMTVYANVDLAQQGIDSRKIEGGLLRLAAVLVLAALLPVLERMLRRARRARERESARELQLHSESSRAIRRQPDSPVQPDSRPAAERGSSAPGAIRLDEDSFPRPESRWLTAVAFLRTMLPFVMCIAVYTNLHDTVRYVNPHDVHAQIAAVEQWIFGGQPVIWAERYITPARTEFFNLFYANFYLVAPSVVMLLWFRGRTVAARRVLLGVILCFYVGYVLYIVFPAAPPRLYFGSIGLFTVTLRGGPITNFQEALIGLMPNHAARAAFPSLHSAVSCLSLYYAWKYCRWFFPILLTFVAGLLVSTVYLRHHWVVDLIAGALLVPFIIWLTPRYERAWMRLGGRAD
jgi:membrane-associated phospholipid phosphatase